VKRTIKYDQATYRDVPNYPEFTSRYIIQNKLISEEVLKFYFPNNRKHVDKWFTWVIWETLEPDAAKRHFNTVMDKRAIKVPCPNTVGVVLTKRWAKELSAFMPMSK
jgi:hypothetical protein